MANELPEYRRTQQLGEGPLASVRALPLPDLPAAPDVGAADRALSGFGAELTKVAGQLQQGEQHTIASQAMEDFLTSRAGLQKQFVADTDYETAEARFADAIEVSKREALGRISDPVLRGKASLEMTRAAISSGNEVHTAQVARQSDVNIAANDTLMRTSLVEASTAKSPQERAAAIDRVTSDLARLRGAGWIDARTEVQRAQTFSRQLDQSDAMTLVQKDPARAIEALSDPKMFASLDPVMRTSLTLAAQGKQDANSTAIVTNATNSHPEAGSLAVGRVVRPEHAQNIFDNGIVQIESGGDNTAVSPKGALGASQIMPATAREVAAQLGLKDIAALSDADLKKRLLSDQPLNTQLGRAYWQQQVTRYEGNLALAAAAYNAGPSRADAWKAAAEAKFGPTFTAAQLASVIDIKETRDYLGRLWGRFNVPMDVGFSSSAAALHAASSVDAVLTQQQARAEHVLAQLASAEQKAETQQAQMLKAGAAQLASIDPVPDLLKSGADIDPQRIAAYRSTMAASAAKGDTAAAAKLRELDTGLKMQPMIRQAWSMPAAALETSINNLEAQISAPGANPTQEQFNAVKAFRAVLAEQVTRRDSEPVVLGGENGGRFYSLQPLDAKSPLDDSLTSALKARDAQALIARQHYGGTGSPFTVQEAADWHQRYTEAAPQERAALIGKLAEGLSPRTFAAALPQVIKGETKADMPELMVAAGLYRQAPDVAQSIIEGIGAIKADKRYLPSSEANKKTYLTDRDSALPPALFDRAGRTDPAGSYAMFSQAVDARYAFLSAQARDVSEISDSKRLKQAVADVTGGVLNHNGAPLIAPVRGMSQRDFDATVWGLGDHDLAGAQTTGGKPIDAAYVRGSAKLVSRAEGQYYLQVNRDDANPQYAVTRGGAPFVLDLRNRQMADLSKLEINALQGGVP